MIRLIIRKTKCKNLWKSRLSMYQSRVQTWALRIWITISPKRVIISHPSKRGPPSSSSLFRPCDSCFTELRKVKLLSSSYQSHLVTLYCQSGSFQSWVFPSMNSADLSVFTSELFQSLYFGFISLASCVKWVNIHNRISSF